jgi:hypothetical protein
MLHYPVPVNGGVRPVEIKLPVFPAAPAKHRVSRKMCLALLAAAIRRGVRPTQRELAEALGISVNMISVAEGLNGRERAEVEAGERPLIMPAGPRCLPAPLSAAVTPADPISSEALAEIVRKVGVDRIINACIAHERSLC